MPEKTRPVIECKACGREFQPSHSNQKYCPACRDAGYRQARQTAKEIENAVKRGYARDYDVGVQVLEMPCMNCGKPMRYVTYRNQSIHTNRYCSRRCRLESHAKETKCVICGKPMLETGQLRNLNGKPWTCSPQCAEQRKWDLARQADNIGTCPVCGKEFVGKNTKTFCSQACYQKSQAEKKAAIENQPKTCPVCERKFAGPSMFCSDECAARNRKRQAEASRLSRQRQIAQAGRLKERARILDTGLCAVCTVPYADCRRMQSTFAYSPEGAALVNGKIIRCPRFRTSALKYLTEDDLMDIAAQALGRDLPAAGTN